MMGKVIPANRLRCVVPFCPRTSPKRDFDEWICGDHWRMVRKARRRAYGRHLKRWRRYGLYNGGLWIGWRLWRVIRREAIERSAGVS